MKLLLDMNMSPRLAGFLRATGFEATHWAEIGDIIATDQTILTHAATAGMIVITHDLDFGNLLASGNHGAPSVIQIRADDLSVAELGDKLLAVLEDLTEELEAGALVTLDPVRIRVTVLPLRRQ